jgi:drug/metabolite transporter (DMT)-like permease
MGQNVSWVASDGEADALLRRRGQLYVALAAIAWSTAGLLQRQLEIDTATQVSGRAVFALVTLLAYVAAVERGRVVQAFLSVGRAGLAIAVCMAVASGAFFVALNHTTVANALFLQASSPVLAAVLARVFLGEPVGRRTALALATAIVGVAVMIGRPGAGGAFGDAMAMLSALAFALVIVVTRHRRDVSMAPATCLSQVLVVLVLLPFAAPATVGTGDLLALAALGGGQISLGLVLLTIGARLIPVAQVGLITLLEAVLGPLWVWLALDERPAAATLVGGAIVIAAIAVQIRDSPPPDSAPAEAHAPIPPPH